MFREVGVGEGSNWRIYNEVWAESLPFQRAVLDGIIHLEVYRREKRIIHAESRVKTVNTK